MVTPKRYIFGGILWGLHHCLAIPLGIALKAVFDRVNEGPAGAGGALPLLGLVLAVEAFRAVEFFVAIQLWPKWWHVAMATIRLNLLRSILRDPTPPSRRLPGSSGEAQARFRDDVEDIVWFVDNWVDVAGMAVCTVLAFGIMARIDPVVAVVVVVPLVSVFAAIRMIGERIQHSHGATRASGSSVTALIGDTVTNALALKSAGAERNVMRRLHETNAERRDNAVRAGLYVRLMDLISGGSADIAIGLTLLFAAGAMRRDEFTVGDLSLFTVYAQQLTWGPRWLGRVLARSRHMEAVLPRLARLLEEPEVERVVEHTAVHISQLAPEPAHSPSPLPELHRLDVVGLTSRHPSSDRGVEDVTFTIDRGSFTVLTGAVGSGKTTLVRAMLGLLPLSAGEVRWNDEAVDDRHAVLVPGRISYAGQVPRLFSDTLEENLRLGWPATDADVDAALALAALDEDVDEFADGLQTMVGARGVRLSGGQLQRATAARAFVRDPDLLIVDDLSSALDVETEQRLWALVASRPDKTCLVVSHRRAAMERADQIVVLDGGRVAAVGPLAELLRTSPEMQRLWVEESFVEAEEALGA